MLHIVEVSYCSVGYAYTVYIRHNTFSLSKMPHIVEVSPVCLGAVQLVVLPPFFIITHQFKF
jgi:hypothetical protein